MIKQYFEKYANEQGRQLPIKLIPTSKLIITMVVMIIMQHNQDNVKQPGHFDLNS